MLNESSHQGHRERLRERFSDSAQDFSDQDYLELLLTYAIPRSDVRPITMDILARYGTLERVLTASPDDLKSIFGLGSGVILFIKLISDINRKMSDKMPEQTQPALFAAATSSFAKPRKLRVFANDEIENSLQFLPQAANYSMLSEFKNMLESQLPYNSFETRQRRAGFILDRFYSMGSLGSPLTYASSRMSRDEFKPVVFYHLAQAEPILAKVADEFVFPALPIGKVTREQLREFVLKYLPGISASSQANLLRSILTAYDSLDVGRVGNETLRMQFHAASLHAFVYILISEYPDPGIYTFDSLFSGPAHRWLLWDKDWIRKQLYLLRDMGIVSKVSEIDTVRQFSLELGQNDCLRHYFDASANIQDRVVKE